MQKPMRELRNVVNFKDADFKTYGLQGAEQSDLSWCNISYDEKTGNGAFIIKFDPGGVSIEHEHLGFEEFVLLEGDLTDHDGYRYNVGDVVSLPSGSRHRTVSENGAIVAVFVRDGFRTLSSGEEMP